MTLRVNVERSPAFALPWLVFGPDGGKRLLLATFADWPDAITWAHHKAGADDKAVHDFVDEFITPGGTHYKLAT